MKLSKFTLHDVEDVMKDSEMKHVLGGTNGRKTVKCYQDDKYKDSWWKEVDDCDRYTVAKACGFEPGSGVSCA